MVEGGCGSGLGEAQNPRKRTESFAWRNERFRIAGRKSLESLPAKSCRFARLFVFNNLTAFSFRLFRGLRAPTPKAQVQRIVKRSVRGRFTSPRCADGKEQVGPRASAFDDPRHHSDIFGNVDFFLVFFGFPRPSNTTP
jgi:hypothetical protein